MEVTKKPARTGTKNTKDWAEREAGLRKAQAHKKAITKKVEAAFSNKKLPREKFAGKVYVLYKHLDADSSPASGWSASINENDLKYAGFDAVVTHGPGTFDWDVWVARK